MSKVFISYAREDSATAIRLYRDLKDQGLEPWIDTEELLPGQSWEAKIRQAISASSYFLALISQNSVSKRGFIQKELRQGMEILDEYPPDKIYIIPIRLEDVEPSHAKLNQLQRVDLFRSYDDALRKIKLAIEQPSSGSSHANSATAIAALRAKSLLTLPRKLLRERFYTLELWGHEDGELEKIDEKEIRVELR
jgi:hypothetical protein